MKYIERYEWLDWTTWQTPRWMTAINRNSLSQPARLGLENGIIKPAFTMLDYGCGHGEDVNSLVLMGVKASGFDAFYAPKPDKLVESDVVQIAFVLNVIENACERIEVLQLCSSLSRRALIVAVQPPNRSKGRIGEGTTSIGTYQKYFSQSELRELILEALGDVRVKALGSGIMHVSCANFSD